MTASRCYGFPRSPTDAMDEIRRHRATQFCPDAIRLLDTLSREDELGARTPRSASMSC